MQTEQFIVLHHGAKGNVYYFGMFDTRDAAEQWAIANCNFRWQVKCVQLVNLPATE